MREPSAYQQAIFDWIRDGRGDGAVDAVAGSGKTTTLVEATRHLRTSNALFLAFNKHIVNELQNRLGGGVTCRTLNGLGHSAIARKLGRERQVRLEPHKYRDLARQIIESYGHYNAQAQEGAKAVAALIGFAQSSLCELDDEALADLAARYNVEPVKGVSDGTIYAAVRFTLEQGEQMAHLGIISFDDQIWLPAKWKLRPTQAEWVLVDECQDLSAAKLELALAARAPGGRMLFVGDKKQSIYGFAGADADSWDKIVRRTGATVLPLSVCYRCSTTVIARAQSIVPHIEAAPGAQVGEVYHIPEATLTGTVRTGDLVLCRLTAPLIKLCVQLIARRVPARVKGRDLARALNKVAADALGRLPYDELPMALETYFDLKCALLEKRKNSESQIQRLGDQVDGVRACIDAFPDARSLAELAECIDSLFSDGESPVELSTVHRAKGLEADRVFIIAPEKLPLVWKNQQPWEAEQETNLKYVAITRARHSLIFVDTAQAAPAAAKPEKELALL